MAELTPELAPEVVAACRAAGGELSEALSRTLDVQLAATVGDAAALDLDAWSTVAAGPGLAIVLHCADRGLLAVLPESSGMVPAWCAAPDATGKSKLATLAQELGMMLLPDSCPADDFRGFHVADVAATVAAAQPAPQAVVVAVELAAGDGRTATMHVLFPLLAPQAAAAAPKPVPAAPAPATQDKSSSASAPAPRSAAPRPAARHAPRDASELPSYTRSLLKIRVPVTVTLAAKKHPVSQIISLGPGAILQFDKSCEELLEVDIGGRTVALGEAVKVGDKFGVRLTSMTLPEEQFVPIQKPAW